MPSLLEKASHIVFPRLGSNMNPPVRDVDDIARFSDLLASYPFGGLVLFNGHVDNTPSLLAGLQRLSPHPLLVASDIERGTGQQIKGATLFPHARAAASAGPAAVAEMARITAIEALAIGIHIAFAPVADVNSDPRNPIIGVRSFGDETQEVTRCVKAYVEACRREGLLTTAKHFPGHGNTATDSHAHLPVVERSRSDLDTIDLPPFRAVIEQGVDLIMTAHVAFPALDPTIRPATSSAAILQQLLRDEMRFQGPVITDSLIMGAVNTDEFDLVAFVADLLNAGVDILLDPPDPPAMIEAVVRAVEQRRIPVQRLDEACRRVETLRRRSAEMHAPPVRDSVEIPASHHDEALRIAERAIAVRHAGAASNIGWTRCIFIKPYKTHLDPPEEPLGALLRQTFPHLDYSEVHEGTDPSILESLLAGAGGADRLLAVVVSKPAAWRAFGLPEKLSQFLSRLIRTAPTTLAALGDPQILESYPGAEAGLCTFSDVPASQEALTRWLAAHDDSKAR